MENIWEIARKKYKRGDIVQLGELSGIVTLTYLKWNQYFPHLFTDYYGGCNLYNSETKEWAKIIK